MSANGRKFITNDTQASETPSASERVTVAYHAGPPEIVFYTRTWTRGAPQTIPRDDWTAMQQRIDFNGFDFQEEH